MCFCGLFLLQTVGAPKARVPQLGHHVTTVREAGVAGAHGGVKLLTSKLGYSVLDEANRA